MKILDYIFYRTYSFYKRKKDSTPIFMGCCISTVLVFATLLSLNTLIEVFFLKGEGIAISKYVIILIVIFFLCFFIKRYSNNKVITSLEKRYKNDFKRNQKGWFFILYLALVLLIPISMGFMRHNLGLNI